MRLHEQFRLRGHQSRVAVGLKKSADPDVFELDSDTSRSAWTRYWIGAAKLLNPVRGKFPGPGRMYTWLRLGLGQPRRYCAILRGEEDFDFPATRHLLQLTPNRP